MLAASPAALAQTDARETGASVPATVALLLAGKPFPAAKQFAPALPEPRRTLFVAAGAENGDGSEAHPWNDLQAALRALSPGDRLRVRAGVYSGAFRIDDSCRGGRDEAPIQVVFDGRASLTPRADDAALTIRRARWLLLGAFVELGASAAPGISIERGARRVTLDGARVSGGRGPGIQIGAGASDVTIANARISKTRVANPDAGSVGIRIAAGTERVTLVNNRLHENPAGSIHVDAPQAKARPARDLRIVGNGIHDDDSTAIFVGGAERLRISGNTIMDVAGRTETRGIALEAVRDATVMFNHVSRCAVGIQVGHADPAGGMALRADGVAIERNVLENAPRSGTAFAVEAGERIVFANNVVDGYANGILVFGRPPRTSGVVAANNLLLGVSDTALLLEDAAAAPSFDYNLFSPAGAAVVEIAGRREPLVRWIKTLPHGRVVLGVTIANHDLARIRGAETVDRGRKIEGIEFKGAAPDIGVAER